VIVSPGTVNYEVALPPVLSYSGRENPQQNKFNRFKNGKYNRGNVLAQWEFFRDALENTLNHTVTEQDIG
jgi:hypothetical protein